MPAGNLEAEELAPPLPSYRLATSWVYFTTSCKHSLLHPEDGRNHRPKHAELIGINNKPVIVAYNWLSTIFVSTMHGQTNIKQVSRLHILAVIRNIHTASLKIFAIIFDQT